MARNFDRASSQYLEISSAVLTGSPLVMACWFNPSNDTNEQIMVSIADFDGNSYYMLTARGDVAGDKLQAQSRGAGFAAAQTSTGYTTGTWHHACGLWPADDDRRVFIDGGSKGTNSVSQTPSGLDTTLISSRIVISSHGVYFDGSICEAGIWDLSNWPGATASDKADNFEAIALPALAKGFSPLFFQLGLVAYWPLIRDTDQDMVGGYHMTATNNPTIAAHPPKIFTPAPTLFVPIPAAAAGGQNIAMDALTLASAPQVLTIVPGAVSLPMDALTLASSIGALTVSPGVVSLAMDALTLASSPQALTVTPGAVSIALGDLTLTASPQSLTVSPGAVAIALDALTLASTIGALTVSPDAIQIAMDVLTLASNVGALTVTPGAVSISMDALTLAGSVGALSVSTGVYIALAALTLASSAQTLTLSPGAVAIALDALTLAGSAQSLTVSTGALVIAMAALTLAGSAGALDVLNYLSSGPTLRASFVRGPSVRIAQDDTATIRSSETLDIPVTREGDDL